MKKCINLSRLITYKLYLCVLSLNSLINHFFYSLKRAWSSTRICLPPLQDLFDAVLFHKSSNF